MTNPFDILGKTYPGVPYTGYKRDKVIIGATYLLTRDYTDGQIAIARHAVGSNVGSNVGIVLHRDRNWYATLVNPPVKVGDKVYGLERGDGKANTLRKDRVRTVTAVSDAGVLTKYSTFGPIPLTHWVLAEGSSTDPKKDRFNPDRRKIVLDRLSKEGMSRISDTGYAVSAKEFFDNFDLPRPPIEPTALIDVEREIPWRDMPYEMRSLFERDGLTSLRNATITGRAKVKLDASVCRCKEVTPEEALAKFDVRGRWKNAKLHKVTCLWCMNEEETKEAVANYEF